MSIQASTLSTSYWPLRSNKQEIIAKEVTGNGKAEKKKDDLLQHESNELDSTFLDSQDGITSRSGLILSSPDVKSYLRTPTSPSGSDPMTGKDSANKDSTKDSTKGSTKDSTKDSTNKANTNNKGKANIDGNNPKLHELDTISEASRENSEFSSRQQSVVKLNQLELKPGDLDAGMEASRRLSNWWFWNSTEESDVTAKVDKKEANNDLPHVSEEPETQSTFDEEATQWIDWSLQYRRMSSVVGFVYRPLEEIATTEQAISSTTDISPTSEISPTTEISPATIQNESRVPKKTAPVTSNDFNIPKKPSDTSKEALHVPDNPKLPDNTPSQTLQTVHSDKPIESSSSWLTWVWRGRNEEEAEDEDEGTAAFEIYKSAKHAIENSKESTHYASRYSLIEDSINTLKQVELAVSDTASETQPVRYNKHKRPLTANEVQEQSMIVVTDSRNLQVLESRVLPMIEENIRTITWRTKMRLVVEDMVWHNKTSEKHLYRKRTGELSMRRKHKMNKVVIIGIHGFLPIKMVKSLIGQLTGNSIRLVKEATRQVQDWLRRDNPDYDHNDYDFQTIALEGEGRIGERVEKLLHLLENWQGLLDECDFLYIVLHAQGTPVAVQMLAKLLNKNDLIMKNYHRKKIGLLSISGIFAGPFEGLDTKLIIRAYTPWENEIMAELFELQKRGSRASEVLDEAMKQLMKFGNVKVVLCGSISDQFIPLYSALALQYQHPNIYRMVHVAESKKNEVPPFILTLLKTAVMMKNMGWRNDYGIIREFSDRCVGSVGENGGHGKIYGDGQVYFEATRYILETTTLTNIHHHGVETVAPASPMGSNLYLLPWNIRCLLQDLTQVNNIGNVQLLHQLVKEFREWEPVVKHWREIKYCCDAFSDLVVEELIL